MPDYGTMGENCPNIKENLTHCNCSYNPCERKGLCCQCLHYHRKNGELPACYFPDTVERTFDRSISRFIRDRK